MNPSPGPWRWEHNVHGERYLVSRNGKVVLISTDDGDLAQLAPEMREMLMLLEWSASGDGYDCCFICGAETHAEPKAHAPDCKLGALLEKLR